MPGTNRATVRRAKALRRRLTKPEAALWQLFQQRPSGLKFRRQHPLGPYVLDFYCARAKLVIEVDGIAHDLGDNPERDVERDAWLTRRRLRVLRVPAAEVLGNIESVLTYVVDQCLSSPSRSDGEGDRTKCGGGA